jgi:hypothetical protein
MSQHDKFNLSRMRNEKKFLQNFAGETYSEKYTLKNEKEPDG